jgi:hypothetical protein
VCAQFREKEVFMLINQAKMQEKVAKHINNTYDNGVVAARELKMTRANISLAVTKKRAPTKKLLHSMGYEKVNMYRKIK